MRAALPAIDRRGRGLRGRREASCRSLQLILRELEDLNDPRFLFLNKIDKAEPR
jgi:elongation factor G